MAENHVENDVSKYFGIYIPPEDEAVSNDKSCVVKELKVALSIFKRNPNSRFRTAATEAEAWFAAKDPGSEATAAATTETPVRSLNTTERRTRRNRLSLPALDNIRKSVIAKEQPRKPFVGEEKDTRFPTPKIQELTAMAREINSRKNSAVIERVNTNPKVLVNDCDRPTTVQEGCRYNALHMAAKSDNYEIIGYILNTVSSYKYMTLLYPNSSPDIIKDRIRYVTDAYLNTPDKMSNETPLHFASKFLCVNAVDVLGRHPWCNLNVKNICQETPADMVGSRGDPKAPDFAAKKQTISRMLSNMFTVPIWRDPLGVCIPAIGTVAHLRSLGECTPPCLLKEFPDFDVKLLGPCDKSILPLSKLRRSSVRVFDENNSWEIKAFAGLTSHEKAMELWNSLKVSRGYSLNDSPAPQKILFDSTNSFTISPATPDISPKKEEQGAGDANTTPPPRTPPQTGRTPFASPQGPYSPYRFKWPDSPAQGSPGPYDYKNQRLKDVEKGLERNASQFAFQNGIKWNEEWEFLEYFGDILSEEGLQTFERHLQQADIPRVLDNYYTNYKADYSAWRSHNTSFMSGMSVSIEDEADQLSLDSDCEDEWHSPAASDSDDDEYLDCQDASCFVNGKKPSKSDFQLFALMKINENAISNEKYPLVFQWFNCMKLKAPFENSDRKGLELTTQTAQKENNVNNRVDEAHSDNQVFQDPSSRPQRTEVRAPASPEDVSIDEISLCEHMEKLTFRELTFTDSESGDESDEIPEQ